MVVLTPLFLYQCACDTQQKNDSLNDPAGTFNSEEVFDFSGGKMTQDKIIEKKTGLKDEFAQIYELCDFVLKNASNSGLISSTLQTLQSFIHWISPQYIFETQMLEALIMKVIYRFIPIFTCEWWWLLIFYRFISISFCQWNNLETM